MIPAKLLQLACLEFMSREDALIAGRTPVHGYCLVSRPIVRLSDPTKPQFVDVSQSTRYFNLEELPSGRWAYVPQHPDDKAIVAEWTLRSGSDSTAKSV